MCTGTCTTLYMYMCTYTCIRCADLELYTTLIWNYKYNVLYKQTLTLHNNCLHFIFPEARHFNRLAISLTGLHTLSVLLQRNTSNINTLSTVILIPGPLNSNTCINATTCKCTLYYWLYQ